MQYTYDQVVTEYFDITHSGTRDVLIYINEDDKSNILQALSGKLYKQISDRAYSIDFTEIEKTRGDIDKLEKLPDMLETLSIIKNVADEYGMQVPEIDVVTEAIDNLRKTDIIWMEGYEANISISILFYNSVATSIVASVSLLVSTCIDFIKSPENDYRMSFSRVSYRRNKDFMLFKNLEQFNQACRKNQIQNTFQAINKNKQSQLTGADDFAVIAIVSVITLLTLVIPLLREMVYFFYHSRQNLSDWFAIQSELVYINAEYVSVNDMNGLNKREKDAIIKRQHRAAATLKQLSNYFAVDAATAQAKAKQDSKKDTSVNKNMKITDVTTSKPDSYDESRPNSIW